MIKYIILMICFVLVGCSNASSNILTSSPDEIIEDDSVTKEEAFSSETEVSTYDSIDMSSDETELSTDGSIESSPFKVEIDKPSLELKKTKETRVFIATELTEWSYTVKAEYGTISEIQSNSFIYTRPKDEKQEKDVITIVLTDGENKVQYKNYVSLNYIFNPQDINDPKFKESVY